jgi:hypothetical protein
MVSAGALSLSAEKVRRQRMEHMEYSEAAVSFSAGQQSRYLLNGRALSRGVQGRAVDPDGYDRIVLGTG